MAGVKCISGTAKVAWTKQILLLAVASLCHGQSRHCRRPEDKATFDREAGPGYIAHKAESMTDICVGSDSWLKCTESLEFCVGRNLQIEFPSKMANSGAKKR